MLLMKCTSRISTWKLEEISEKPEKLISESKWSRFHLKVIF